MSASVACEKRGVLGLVTVDNPPVNALSQAVRQGLVDAMAWAAADPELRAVVLCCKGRTFIAGADIREFGKPNQPPHLPAVVDAIEQSAKPVVAALHGTALGGGLEVALGCHYRVAAPDARLGLPEVKLGLIPGAGGTQRLPRLIGVEPALELITSGEPLVAARARELGLVDAVIEGDLVAGALGFAEQLIAEARPPRRTSELSARLDSKDVFERYAQDLQKKKRGFEAPQACVEAVRASIELPFAEGMLRERELFTGLIRGSQSAALRHVFFAEREAAKVPDVPADTPKLPVQRVGVIGAGTMGAGIAMCFADAGMDVVLLDQEQRFVDKGLETIRGNYASIVKRGKLSETEAATRTARVRGTTDYAALADADLVIEAVFEEMAIKQQVFQKLDQVCKPGCILATNTSTLDVNLIAASTRRPESVIGLHFFSPAHIMRLLEVVRGARTDKTVIATSMQLAKTLGKIGVLVGVCHGFVGNRILYPYRREALFLIEEGASPQQVDRVITDFGLPMGPFAMSDLAGLDIGWRVRKAQGKPVGERYSGTIPDRLCEQGHFGQKTGQGFYRYEAGSRTPKPYPELQELILGVSKELGIERREIGDEEILERCILPMVNEGAKILEEGIALRASDIDVVWLHGYGFPSYRGGPMHYGESLGLDQVHARIKAHEARHGAQWKPAALLERLAGSKSRFDRA